MDHQPVTSDAIPPPAGTRDATDPATTDLAALVRAAQAGDAYALDQLIAGHLGLVYHLVGQALGGHADVDDLVQETMLRAMRGLPQLREPDRFRSWLVTIAYRQIQQHLRNRRQTRLRTQDLSPDLPDPAGDFAQRTVAELELTGQRRELAQAAAWLDDRDRQLLALWWQQANGALTRAELADALALTPQHVSVRLQRLRARLDAARVVVRALHARPHCPTLERLLPDWRGVVDSRWRKRLTRHIRDCPHCQEHRHGLVAPADLLYGIGLVPLPVAAAAGLRAALDAAGAAGAAPAALEAGPSIMHSVLAYLHGLAQQKTVVAATVTAVAAGGGLVYAVVETPIPADPPAAVASPTPAAAAPAEAPPAPGPAAPPSQAPAERPVPAGVASADVYVAPDGADNGDGSLARPYATLARAVEVIRPGQTIALRGGTYRPAEPIIIETDGEPQLRITLSNYLGERPVLDASQIPADKWAVTHRASYWTVQGLAVMNSGSHAYVCTACRENVFWRMSFHDNVRSGLTLRDPGTTGNQVLDSDFYRNYDPAGEGRAGVGLAIKFGSGAGNLVRGCRAFHNADAGFDVGHFEDPVTLEHNWAYGNGVNRWDADPWRANADGFHLGGGSPPPSAEHVLAHNAAWDNIGHGFSDGGNPAALALHHNTAFRNGGIGFHLSTAAAVFGGNAAIDNASPVALAGGARSNGNTWDGGDWSAAMFRSTDPATAEDRRRPDGGLPPTDFLVSTAGVGAAMSRPRRRVG